MLSNANTGNSGKIKISYEAGDEELLNTETSIGKILPSGKISTKLSLLGIFPVSFMPRYFIFSCV